MRKKIQAVLAALALFIMTVADASCSKCSQENNKSDFMNCLCPLAELGIRQKPKVIAYVRNGGEGLASSCVPDGSLDCPYHHIKNAVDDSPEGAEIRVIYTGINYQINSTIVLKPRQTLQGWSLASNEKGAASSVAKPTLHVTAAVGIVLANHSKVSNLAFNGSGATDYVGIASEGAHQATISNNAFHDFFAAIYLESVGGTKTTVSGNTFDKILAYGIYADTTTPSAFKIAGSTKRAASSKTKAASLYELIIQENTFTNPNGSFVAAIALLGVGKLSVLDNTVTGYAVGLAADVVITEAGIIVSEPQTAVAGTSLQVLRNNFTGLTSGNGADTFSNMVIRGNTFACVSSIYNVAAFRVSLHGGATACVTGNTFTGCNSSTNAAGFKVVAAESTGQALPCLQLTGNKASVNGMDYDLNVPLANPPLHINNSYDAAGVNQGNFFNGDLVRIQRCFNCGI